MQFSRAFLESCASGLPQASGGLVVKQKGSRGSVRGRSSVGAIPCPAEGSYVLLNYKGARSAGVIGASGLGTARR